MPLESASEQTSDQEQIIDQTQPPVEGSPGADSTIEQSGGQVDAAETSGISDELAELARFHELDPADFPTAEQLERAVGRLDRIYAHRVKQGWGDLGQQRSGQQAGAQRAGAAAAEKPSLKPFELGLKPLAGDYDPELIKYSEQMVKTLADMNAHYVQQFQQYVDGTVGPLSQQYGEKIGMFEQYLQERSAQEYTAQMDAAFDKLGKEWEELFGKGPLSALPPHSIVRQKRDEVSMELAAIQQGDAQMGRRQSFEQQFQRAVRAAFGNHLPTIERRKLAKQAHERKNGALNPPTAKKQPIPTDEKMVLARLKEWTQKVDSER